MDTMEEFVNPEHVEFRGSRRIELLFSKNNVMHDLYKNIKNIYALDANEGDKYMDWLMNEKLPKLKDSLETALVKEFINSGDDKIFWEYVTKLQDNFTKYKELIHKEASELEFLKSYA